MKRGPTLPVIAILAALVIAGCSAATPTPALTVAPTAVPTTAPTKAPAAPTTAPTASAAPAPTAVPKPEPTRAAAYVPSGLPTDKGTLFAGSGVCVCHSNLKDAAGADASIDTHWRASMQAQAARDPYWQASVRAEVLANPSLQAVIEDKCATCHMPMAQTTDEASGGKGKILGDGYTDPKSKLNTLAMDGVSCTLCHQITSVNLGQAASFSGGFDIETKAAMGARVLYGPFAPQGNQTQMHANTTGFDIKNAAHATQPELCASCHTLFTPYVNAKGEVAGTFPEQMAYFEWKNSSLAGKTTCQECHMTQAGGSFAVAMGGPARTPVRNHVFVGGNVYMIQMLAANAQELNLSASSAQMGDHLQRTEENLTTKVAVLSLVQGDPQGSKLVVDVAVKPMLGHKFPTGFPSRRAWLHVQVKGSDGKVVFESGGHKPDGSIAGNDNDADATRFEPHYASISSPDQVQIYEALIKDTEGKLTTVLLRGSAYAKDNRLLPPGFDKAKAGADIAVIGEAKDDADFGGSGDTVRYVIDPGAAKGPFVMSVELLYQSIGFRWAQNLSGFQAPEVARFSSYYKALPNTPAVVADASLIVQ